MNNYTKQEIKTMSLETIKSNILNTLDDNEKLLENTDILESYLVYNSNEKDDINVISKYYERINNLTTRQECIELYQEVVNAISIFCKASYRSYMLILGNIDLKLIIICNIK